MSLGESIRERRKSLGLTQEALGEKLGMAPQTVSKWERDESMPDAALLPGLADALRTSLDRLFERKTTEYADAAAAARARLLPLDREDRWTGALRLGRIMQTALGGFLEIPAANASIERYDDPVSQTGWCTGEGGFTWSSRRENLPYLLLFPEPKEGWAPLLEKDDPACWQALGKEPVRRALKRIYAGELPHSFDLSWAKEKGGLEEETLAELEVLGVLGREKATIAGKPGELLYARASLLLLAILLLRRVITEPDMGFSGDNRRAPWLRKKETDTNY